MPTVVSDDEAPAHVVSRPRRPVTLSSRLTDVNNDATPELSIHRNKPVPVPQTLTSSKRCTDEVFSLLSDDADGEGNEEEPRKSESHSLLQSFSFILIANYFRRQTFATCWS